MTKIEIRRAAAEDLDAIFGIEYRSFGADAFTRRQLGYLIAHARGICFAALYDGKVCGYISLLERTGFSGVRIYSVAVAPEIRSCGAGQALLDAAIAYAQARNLRNITLEVSVGNTAAQALYRKNGFLCVGRIPAYYHDGTDAWRMKREF